MITEFIEIYEEKKNQIREAISKGHPESYAALVKIVLTEMFDDSEDYSCDPDCTKIHKIDDGDYQGTLLFIIPERTYQPHKYWAIKVYYGSCSGCDTLQAISEYSSDLPTEEQIKDYMNLSLNIVQWMKEI